LKIRIGEKGELIEEPKIKSTSRIDLVAVSNNGFTRGYEVKVDFNSVQNSISSNQLSSYVNSGYFDEVYLVVPENICKRVVASYGQHLSSNDIGLLCVSMAPPKIGMVIKPSSLVN